MSSPSFAPNSRRQRPKVRASPVHGACPPGRPRRMVRSRREPAPVDPRGHDPGRALLELVGRGPHCGLGCRRMALESAVHRYDAELSVGSPSTDSMGARRRWDRRVDRGPSGDRCPESPDASLGGVLCLACSDDAAAWTVEVTAGRLRWREGGAGRRRLRGSASDLYLFCWNRQAARALELTGNRASRRLELSDGLSSSVVSCQAAWLWRASRLLVQVQLRDGRGER